MCVVFARGQAAVGGEVDGMPFYVLPGLGTLGRPVRVGTPPADPCPHSAFRRRSLIFLNAAGQVVSGKINGIHGPTGRRGR